MKQPGPNIFLNFADVNYVDLHATAVRVKH